MKRVKVRYLATYQLNKSWMPSLIHFLLHILLLLKALDQDSNIFINNLSLTTQSCMTSLFQLQPTHLAKISSFQRY